MISEGPRGEFSIDTGIQSNVMSDQYFNMNERHMNQNLYPMLYNEEEIKKAS